MYTLSDTDEEGDNWEAGYRESGCPLAICKRLGVHMYEKMVVPVILPFEDRCFG